MYLILYLYGGVGKGNFQGYRQWIKKKGARSFFSGEIFRVKLLA